MAATRVMRSSRQHSSDLARDIVNFARPVSVRTPAGLYYAGTGYSIPVREERVIRVLQFIVRGLYFRIHDRLRLPANCVVGVRRVKPEEVVKRCEELASISPYGPVTIGEGVLTFVVGTDSEDPRVSVWGLVFYGHVMFMIRTDPPANESSDQA